MSDMGKSITINGMVLSTDRPTPIFVEPIGDKWQIDSLTTKVDAFGNAYCPFPYDKTGKITIWIKLSQKWVVGKDRHNYESAIVVAWCSYCDW